MPSSNCVLIETLWNVKIDKTKYNELTAGVLIETLWNVKIRRLYDNFKIGLVLIETLWNVKTSTGSGRILSPTY